jgi:ribosomal protein L18E
MPLQRRIPKRGFKNINRVEYQAVNVRDLSRIEAGEVTPEILKQHGLIGTLRKPVKILGTGEVEGAYQVTAHAFSGTARAKIEGAGGTVTVLGGPQAESAPSDRSAGESSAAAEGMTEIEETPVPEGDEASEAEDEKA